MSAEQPRNVEKNGRSAFGRQCGGPWREFLPLGGRGHIYDRR
jgi:hypothetical protein